MRVVIVLSYYPFSERDYERYSISTLKKNFQVIIPNISPWLISDKRSNGINNTALSGPLVIKNKQDFNVFLDGIDFIKPPIVISVIPNNFKTLYISKKFSKLNALFVSYFLGPLPAPINSGSKIVKRLKQLIDLGKIFNRVSALIIEKVKHVPDIVFIGGEASLSYKDVKNCRTVIPAHSFDYDLWFKLNRKQTKFFGDTPYAVFLDEDMVDHPDIHNFYGRKLVSPERYYRGLKSFFNHVEQTYKMKVVFAAHPRNKLEKGKEFLKSFNIVSGNTADLIRNSSLVLVHQSTSKSFAVLWRKPILFLTSDEIQSSWISPYVLGHAHFFSSDLVNIDKPKEYPNYSEELLTVDEENYISYERKFLKAPGGENKLLEDIVTENLMRYV